MCECGHLLKTKRYLEEEVQETRADKRRLQEEITALRRRLVDLGESLHYEKCQHKMSKRKLEDMVYSNEDEKRSILSKQDDLLCKVRLLEETVECLNKRVIDILEENVCWQNHCSHLKEVNERLQSDKRNVEESSKDLEEDVTTATQQIKRLEEEKRCLKDEMCNMKKETDFLKDKLLYLAGEKENLKGNLDSKAVDICKLEEENSRKYCQINQLEEKISRLNCELIRSTNEEARAQKEICALKRELKCTLEEKGRLQIDIKKMTTVLESMIKELEVKECESKKIFRDVNKLKENESCYLEKLQQLEKCLEMKDKEKEDTLHHIKTLEAKIMSIEKQSEAVENEKKWTLNNLRVAENKIEDLQETVKTKESLIGDMECQLKDLCNNVRSLKNELSSSEQKHMALNNELATNKQVIANMEYEKKAYDDERHALERKVEQVTHEIGQSQAIIKELTCQVEMQKKTITSLESAIDTSRKEARQESLQNYSVNQKVQELQLSVNKLQEKLGRVNNALTRCQSTCSEYKLQNNALTFKMTNDRYAKALSGEDICGLSVRNETKDICSYVCSCDNKGKVYFKSKSKDLTDSIVSNKEANYECESGLFTISLKSGKRGVDKMHERTQQVFSLLENTRAYSAEGQNLNRANSTHRSESGKKTTNDTNKIYEKFDLSCNSDDELPTDNCSYHESRTDHCNDSKALTGYRRKSILKDRVRSEVNLKENVEHLCSNSYLNKNSKKHSSPIKNFKYPNYELKYHNNSYRNYSSEDVSAPLLSIVEESPTYRLTKKCYKKVCFPESKEE